MKCEKCGRDQQYTLCNECFAEKAYQEIDGYVEPELPRKFPTIQELMEKQKLAMKQLSKELTNDSTN